MKNLVEIHILQNFAPSNLNRDDTGSPKDAIFGGHRRARISSQCLKRAAREYLRENPRQVPAEALAVRTRQIVEALTATLVERGRLEVEARSKVVAALGGVGLKVDQENLTEYLLFLGRQEIDRLVGAIDEHWERLVVAEPEEGGGRQSGRAAKRAAKEAVPAEIKTALNKVLDGGKAVDIGLFGRMLADLPEKNQDAACQVAHAISTHAIEREFDFFTAVDDLKERDADADAGAGMLGTVEFTSACFYRYVALDLEQLRRNLQNDTELLLHGVEALLWALARAKPSGKQNSFAAHNDPEYIVCTVRQAADPRNLANAFERPVAKSEWSRQGLTAASVDRFVTKWQRLEKAYGQAGPTFSLNLTDAADGLGTRTESLDNLVAATMGAVRSALGV